jgi:hypothetical protein
LCKISKMARQMVHWGSTLEEFLTEEGILQEATATAITRVVALNVGQPRPSTRKPPATPSCLSLKHPNPLLQGPQSIDLTRPEEWSWSIFGVPSKGSPHIWQTTSAACISKRFSWVISVLPGSRRRLQDHATKRRIEAPAACLATLPEPDPG